MNYWLVKSEPFKYSWDHFVNQGVGMWDGVRNYAARNNLIAMKVDDLVLFIIQMKALMSLELLKL